jgi:hypothetical protein
MAAKTQLISEAFSSHRFSVVSSADVYEFDAEGQVTTIRSYVVELDA